MNADRYEYEFCSIAFGGFNRQPQENHARIVAEHAAQGWRLLQIYIIPTSDGLPKSMELVFERPYSGPRDETSADRPKRWAAEPLFQQPSRW